MLSTKSKVRVMSVLAILAMLFSFANVNPASASTSMSHFNDLGNYLISDQFNNRVIEVDKFHKIVWQFGDGSSVAGSKSIVAPNDAQRVGVLTLMAGTGAPASSEPTCPSGCADNRVLLVNQVGKIVWQYGKAGVTGSGPDELNAPVQATWLPGSDVLITDQGNQRVIEVNLKKQIVWQYGMTGMSGAGFNHRYQRKGIFLVKFRYQPKTDPGKSHDEYNTSQYRDSKCFCPGRSTRPHNEIYTTASKNHRPPICPHYDVWISG
jgi:hypothetical protein